MNRLIDCEKTITLTHLFRTSIWLVRPQGTVIYVNGLGVHVSVGAVLNVTVGSV